MPFQYLRPAMFLLRLSLRRQLLSRQTLVAVALTVLVAVIVLAWERQSNPTSKKLAEQVLVPTFIAFLMPVFAICYGASAVGGEREDRTLIYLLIASIPRWIVLIVKATAAMILSAGWSVATLWMLCLLAGKYGTPIWPVFWPATLLGAAAYAMLFLTLGTVFRHGTLIALAYWFFLEVLFGNIPGIIKRVSIAFYVRCIVYDDSGDLRLGPATRVARETFLPVSDDTAKIVLVAATIGLLLLSAILFSRREYRELG
jgi:ABC-type transport system involved in multi-copper enzyme maturation permease subunit